MIRSKASPALVAGVFGFLLAGPAVAEDTCPCPPAPKPGWDGSFGGGLALTSGNSDTRSFNANGSVVYDPLKNHVFKASGLYLRAENDGEATVDRSALTVREEYKLGPRFFLFGEIAFQRDRFKDLDRLLAPAVGAGYKVVKTEALTVDVDGGLGLAMEKLRGQDGTTNGAVRAGQSLRFKLSKTASIGEIFSALWKLDDLGDAYYHVEGNLTAAVAQRLDLKLAYITDIKSRPADPSREKRDTAVVVAVVYKLRPS